LGGKNTLVGERMTARPVRWPFRLVATPLAAICWYGAIVSLEILINDPHYVYSPWILAFLAFWWFTVIVTYAAVRGLVPRWLTLGQ
jgi:hypothetical protein